MFFAMEAPSKSVYAAPAKTGTRINPDSSVVVVQSCSKAGWMRLSLTPAPLPEGEGFLFPSPSGGKARDEGLLLGGSFPTEVFGINHHAVCPPDGTTSHSTKLAKTASKVAGYARV